MSLKEDFNEINSTIKMMDEQMGFLNTLVENTITSVHNLDLRVREGLEKIHFDSVLSMTDEEVEKFLIDNAEPVTVVNANDVISGKMGVESEPSDANIKALKANQESAPDGWSEKPFYDYARYVLKSIKDSMMEINKLEAEKEQLMKNMHDIQDDYFSYVNTMEYKENKRKRLQELKDSIDQEPDEVKRARIKRDIEAMEKAETLDFLYDQIREKGNKEIANTVSCYFDHNRSSLIMKKFAVRIPKFGYNQDLYKFFFNLEENFLPEEYHVFNNLFLFHVMRTISYMDVNSKTDNLYTSTILVRLYNLVYHKYGDQALEDEFIEFIRKFDDQFMEEYTEKFEKDNVTHPKHPERVEKDAKNEKRRRIMTIAELQNHGLDPDTSLSTDELVELLKKTIEEEENRKKSEVADWSAKHESSDSGDSEDIKDDNDVSESDEDGENEATEKVNDGTIIIDSIPVDPSEPAHEFTEEEKNKVTELVGKIEKDMDGRMITVPPAEDLEPNSIESDVDEMDGIPKEGVQMGPVDMEPVMSVANTANQPQGIDMSSLIGSPLKPAIGEHPSIGPTVTAYFDKHGYYYAKVGNGLYTYYTPDHKPYESGFTEEDIIRLRAAGALEKGFITL